MMINLLAVSIALLANLLANWMLSANAKTCHDATRMVVRGELQPGEAYARHPLGLQPRVMRWLLCVLGLVWLAWWQSSFTSLLLFGLFSVTAATDFETHYLPPDAYLYFCVVVSLSVAFLTRGPMGLRDAVVAEACAFVVVTFAALFGALDSGDIKVAMQLGAACGSLSLANIAVVAMIAVSAIILALALAWSWLQQRSVSQALRGLAHLRVPQAAVCWVGLLAAYALPISGVGR